MHPTAPTLQPVPRTEPVPGTPEGKPSGEEAVRDPKERPLPHDILPYTSQVEQEQLLVSQSLPGILDVEECGECQP